LEGLSRGKVTVASALERWNPAPT